MAFNYDQFCKIMSNDLELKTMSFNLNAKINCNYFRENKQYIYVEILGKIGKYLTKLLKSSEKI